jgi:uncharacterized protein (DUF1684 family)
MTDARPAPAGSDAGGGASSPEPSVAKRLDLADWRRRIADLYTAVRAEAATDPESAWRHWRETRQELFRTHPQSPVPAAGRAAFRAAHWPYDARLRFEVTLTAESAAAARDADEGGAALAGLAGLGGLGLAEPMIDGFALSLPISTGGEERFTRIGRLDVPFAHGTCSLGLYWMAGYAGGLFLPFRDATNGRETYGAGRYLLDTAKSADLGAGAAPRSLILDFNFAFHPSCAFDPRWSCPLAPPENRLDLRIEAGERLP